MLQLPLTSQGHSFFLCQHAQKKERERRDWEEKIQFVPSLFSSSHSWMESNAQKKMTISLTRRSFLLCGFSFGKRYALLSLFIFFWLICEGSRVWSINLRSVKNNAMVKIGAPQRGVSERVDGSKHIKKQQPTRSYSWEDVERFFFCIVNECMTLCRGRDIGAECVKKNGSGLFTTDCDCPQKKYTCAYLPPFAS